MKRSKAITLTLLTGATVAVGACDKDADGEAPRYFKDRDACIAAMHDSDLCADSERQAMAEHATSAQRYMSLQECEDKFGAGQCVAQPQVSASATAPMGVSQLFMPVMAGFMLGRLSNSWFGGSSSYGVQPVCRDRFNNAYAGSCASGGSGMGGTGGGRFAGVFRNNGFQPDTNYMHGWSSAGGRPAGVREVPTITRGGFGSVGRSFFRGG